MGRPKGSKNKVTTPVEMIKSKTTEEVCEEEMRRAAEKGLPDPDWDFRTMYKRGDKIYYVWINHLTGDKELLELTVRTVYARSMIAHEDKGNSHMIGYTTRDMIFFDRYEAEGYYKSVKVVAEYGQRPTGE